VYIVITQNDGDVLIRGMTKEQVEAFLNDEGAPRPLTGEEMGWADTSRSRWSVPNYWEADRCLIIKGELAEVTIGKLNIT
jgi:hypothetical protein